MDCARPCGPIDEDTNIPPLRSSSATGGEERSLVVVMVVDESKIWSNLHVFGSWMWCGDAGGS